MTLAPAEVIALWEDGADLAPLARAVRLAGADGAAWDLPLDARDRRLMDVHRALGGGERIALVATCAACTEPVELSFDAALLHDAPAPPEPLRTPTSRDLADGLPLAIGDARRLLAARAAGVAADTLDADGIDRIEALLEAAGAGDVRLGFACPACGAAGAAPFDPAAQAWRALTAQADALLRDVDRIARAYGWSDAAILELSGPRRRRLLELIG